MAFTSLSGAPAPASHTAPIDNELHIELWPDSFAQFIGSRAQLESEGLIPAGLAWPQKDQSTRWEANGLGFWLRRVRPAQFKGPKAAWVAMNHWCVRVTVEGRDYYWGSQQLIVRKAQALRDEINRQSPAGRRAQAAQFQAICNSRLDAVFQAHLAALLPARAKPGRKAKSTTGAQQ